METFVLAVLVVRSCRLLNAWLGAKPLLAWSADKLARVRGVDRVCALVNETATLRHTRGLEAVEVVVAPVDVASGCPAEDYAMVRWLLYNSDHPDSARVTHVLVIGVEQPFTPAAHVVTVFDGATHTSDQQYVYLAGRPVNCLDPELNEKRGCEATRGVWACHREFLRPAMPQWGKRFSTVPVNAVEALSMLDEQEANACRALVDCGYR